MATGTGKTQLPPLPQEILLLIVDAVVAAADARLAVLPPSHPTTRTLVSLRLTSRRLYPIATQYLYATCLHIDSAARLERLLGSIQALHTPTHTSISGCMPDAILSSMTSLYLSPALSKQHEPEVLPAAAKVQKHDEHIVGAWILQLLTLVGPHLKRLIMQVPPTDHWRHYSVYRQTLTEALSRLTVLDEFVSMQAEMVFAIPWTAWHHSGDGGGGGGGGGGGLKRLALPSGITMMVPNIIAEIAHLARLEVLVLAKPALVASAMRARLWRQVEAEGGDAVPPQKLLVMCLDTSSSHYMDDVSETWSEADQVRFMQIDVPIGYYSDENSLDVCEEFVLRHALRGRLWDLQGRLLGQRQQQQSQ